jgi:hypothetical protein
VLAAPARAHAKEQHADAPALNKRPNHAEVYASCGSPTSVESRALHCGALSWHRQPAARPCKRRHRYRKERPKVQQGSALSLTSRVLICTLVGELPLHILGCQHCPVAVHASAGTAVVRALRACLCHHQLKLSAHISSVTVKRYMHHHICSHACCVLS